MTNLHESNEGVTPLAYRGRLQVDISWLKQQDPVYGQHIYVLDTAKILLFDTPGSGHLGRTMQRLTCEILDDHLDPDKERYVNAGSGQYLLYLKTATRALGELKRDVARKEIRRRAELYIEEKNHGIRKPESARRLPKAKLSMADIEKKKIANMAMKRMAEARERNGTFVLDYSNLAAQTEILFQPVCNVPKKYLTGFLACPATSQNGAHNMVEELGLLVRATQELERAYTSGTRAVIIVPVSLETLRRHPFNCYYMEYCRTISADLRKLIVLQIKNIPDACPYETLQEILRWGSSLMRSVIIKLKINQHFPPYSVASSVHACSVSLDRLSYDHNKNIRFIGSVANKSRSVGCMAMAQGVHSQIMLLAALKAGYAYISGSAIQPDLDCLHPIRPFIPEIYEVKGCN